MKHVWKGLVAAVFAIVLCPGLFCGCAGKTETALEIDDITVTYQERETIVPKSAPDGEIAYTFEGDNIRIQGNIVTGIKGNTETVVTATAANGKITTFTVKVVFENPFGKNAKTGEGGGMFTPVDETTFTKTSLEYGEDYYYAGGNALTGAQYLLTGKLALGEEASDSYAAVIVKESAEKAARFRFAYIGGGEYAVYSERLENGVYAGTEEMYSLRENNLNFAVMVKGGEAYFYCNQSYVGKVSGGFSDAHVGIGGEKTEITASRLRSYTDDVRLNEYVDLTKVVFGAHAYGSANADTVFTATANEGEYRKTNQNYGQSFYYHGGIPVAGKQYTIRFTVKVTDAAASGLVQATFMLLQDDANMVRFALEYDRANSTWFLFTDKKISNTFGSWSKVKNVTGDTVTLKITYNDGECKLYECAGETDTLVQTVNLKTLGQTHFGFGGEKCTITLSGITAKRGL